MQAFPRDLKPMLALLGELPPAMQDPGYAYETKWDGFRALAYWDGRSLALRSRNQLDFLGRFPDLAGLAKALPRRTIVDGEIVALDARGRDSFSAMQQRGQAPRPARIVYHCFDVLWLGGRSTMPLPYLERRALLAGLGLQGGLWDTPPHHVGGGARLLARSLEEGKEGLVAKRVGSPYRPGVRNDDWIKIKNVKRDEFVVAGYAPGEKIAGAGKLLLGYYAPGPDGRPALRFAGGVGTGLTAKERLQFQAFIDQHRSTRNPFATRVDRDAVFTDRPFVVEVAYTEWTHGGSLRHPALVGLRPDKDPQQVTDPRVAAVER